MPLKRNIELETFSGVYVVSEILGEGGAGRVFGGVGPDGYPVAIKVLSAERATTDKRSRFKNELTFLARRKHKNIITVKDHGVSRGSDVDGPFYVMPRYDGSLRDLMKAGIAKELVLPLFSQILDGIEAAHLQDVVHRDLKPENVLYDRNGNTVVIADFGIARFSEDQLAVNVKTGPNAKLFNTQYAAPEQLARGQFVGEQADIYALGLMLNEMFTGSVPHGTQYRLISAVAEQFSFLDGIVSRMLAQAPADRLANISAVKNSIQRYQTEAVVLQRLSTLSSTVIKAGEIDDALASEAPHLARIDWNQGTLTLFLDRPVTPEWIAALRHVRLPSYQGKPPEAFKFKENQASIHASEREVQLVVNYFKNWLPEATRVHRGRLEAAAHNAESQRLERLLREREEQETRLRILGTVKI